MTPEWLSHSALNQYLICSEQYRLARVEKKPEPPAWFLLGGSAVHLATQRMDERDQYPYSEDQIMHLWSEAFNEVIAEAYAAWPEDRQWRQVGKPTQAWPNGQRYEYWNLRGIDAVKAWHDWRIASRPLMGDPTHVEEEVEFTLTSGLIVKGYVDRIYKDPDRECYFPLDIKTGTKRPNSPLQLAFYRHGIKEALGLEVADFGCWWMAKDAQAFDVPIGHITLADLDKITTAYFKGVENEVFIPNLGDACWMCPFTEYCHVHPNFKGDKA
jgi:putative RecB family exonuclease